MTRRLAATTILFLGFTSSYAVDNGVYLLKDGGPGSTLKLPGGYPAEIDRKLRSDEYKLEVVSVTNWNDRFEIHLRDKLGPNTSNPNKYLALVFDGHPIIELGGVHAFEQCDRKLAEKIARLGGGGLVLRKPEGIELLIRFKTKKEKYKSIEPIQFEVYVKNIGGNPVFLEPEFDSKIRSVALSIAPSEGSSYVCQDVRKRFTRTSFGQPRRELKPGEDAIMRREDLRHWYIPTSDGHYHFICTYNLSIYDHIDTSDSVWDGYLAAELSVDYSK